MEKVAKTYTENGTLTFEDPLYAKAKINEMSGNVPKDKPIKTNAVGEKLKRIAKGLKNHKKAIGIVGASLAATGLASKYLKTNTKNKG